MMDYEKFCFVIMPFGTKQVGGREINFDEIFETVFLPAINATKLPEGGNLTARRTDKDFFTGDITLEMFRYIEYSRIALADISGLNANVLYELGVRHHAHQSGTAIFRQVDVLIPFDISHIKAFPYEYEPQENIEKSQQLITQVLEESLIQNRLDSPVRLALQAQQNEGINIDSLLREVENAIRCFDLPKAVAKYQEAIVKSPDNSLLHLELGLLYKKMDRWDEAIEEFTEAVKLSPSYTDALREKGIAENKIYCRINSPDVPSGEDSLLKAVALNPEDFDAYASLAGILKRQKKYQEALAMYKRATEVSRGNPYPLLNELKLQALVDQTIDINNQYKFHLKRAERILRAQVENDPPYDSPWSFFNLSEVCLYLGDSENFSKYLEEGIYQAAKWQIKTHKESLSLLLDSKLALVQVEEAIKLLAAAEDYMYE